MKVEHGSTTGHARGLVGAALVVDIQEQARCVLNRPARPWDAGRIHLLPRALAPPSIAEARQPSIAAGDEAFDKGAAEELVVQIDLEREDESEREGGGQGGRTFDKVEHCGHRHLLARRACSRGDMLAQRSSSAKLLRLGGVQRTSGLAADDVSKLACVGAAAALEEFLATPGHGFVKILKPGNVFLLRTVI